MGLALAGPLYGSEVAGATPRLSEAPWTNPGLSPVGTGTTGKSLAMVPSRSEVGSVFPDGVCPAQADWEIVVAEVGAGNGPRRSWFPILAAFTSGMVLGFIVSRLSPWGRPSVPPAPSVGQRMAFAPEEWRYPEAAVLVKLEGGASKRSRSDVSTDVAFAPNLHGYSTTDPLEKVWRHYAALAGTDATEFKTGSSYSNIKSALALTADEADAAMGGVLYYTGDPARTAVQTATMVAQRPGYSVTIDISRGKDEDRTHITLSAEEKAPRSRN
jgi:hypothetical protein